MGVTLEICVDDLDGLAAAIAGGADRIELCSALALGGLTPSAAFIAQAAQCGLSVMAMIRPRPGNFVWSDAEVALMEAEIGHVRSMGLAGVVLGAGLPDGRLDEAVLTRLTRAASGLDLTLNRCFDLAPDMGIALEQAVALGFRRILTSGGARTAILGSDRIGMLVGQARGRIAIMAGAGVSADTALALLSRGVTELHASCAAIAESTGKLVDLGFSPAIGRQTSADLVRALRQAVH